MSMALGRRTPRTDAAPSGAVEAVQPNTTSRKHDKPVRVRQKSVEHYVAGWRDGRKGLPVPEQGRFTRLQQLQRMLDEECERFRRDFTDTTASHVVALAGLRTEIARARLRLGEAEQALAQHRASPAGASAHFGEHRMPAELVATRRTREYVRKEAQLDDRRRKHRNYLYQLLTQEQEHQSSVEVELERAQARACVAYERHATWLRAYIRGVERTHYDPPALLAAIDHLELTVPGWLTEHIVSRPTLTVQKAA
jgi:hypothetical protein